MDYTTYVGLDVHKDTIAVAIVKEGNAKPESLGLIPNTRESWFKLLKRLLVNNKRLEFCYEAGPCGYELYRFFKERGIPCSVVAPSLVPVKAGDRVKTDRRDAKKLASLFRSGELTPVWVPDEEQEALRDLVRTREDALVDLKRKKHQLSKFLLRNGKRQPFLTNPWTVKHRQWLDTLKFEQPAQQVVFQDYIHALDCAEDRLKRLTKVLEEACHTTVHAPVIAALRALKGVDYITAITLVAEIGDISRFSNPAQLMAYSGMVPSEHSSGLRHRRGSITKTGNKHVRRVVIESAWHYARQPKVSVKLKKRQEGASAAVKKISWRAQDRLNAKFRRLVGRGKPSQKAVVAVARELLGFIWSVSCQANEEMSKVV